MYNGTAWSIASVPRSRNTVFNGVSCVSATFCMAVGTQGDATRSYKWDGTTWSRVLSPSRGMVERTVTSVSCVSASTCVAVGFGTRDSADPSHALMESWDGNVWSTVPGPASSRGLAFTSVSCVNASNCVGVGTRSGPGAVKNSALTATYDGARWAVVPSPALGRSAYLEDVSCVDASNCVAVGFLKRARGFRPSTLVEVWDGAVWTAVPSPSPSRSHSELAAVSCTSASNCVAVGQYNGDQGTIDALIEVWDGTAWTTTPAPETEWQLNYLHGVSCATGSMCVAGGWAREIFMGR
jgi:hypothetical protein